MPVRLPRFLDEPPFLALPLWLSLLNLTGSDFARLLKLIQPTASVFHTLADVLHGQQTLITQMMLAFSCLQRVFSVTSKGQDLQIVGTG